MLNSITAGKFFLAFDNDQRLSLIILARRMKCNCSSSSLRSFYKPRAYSTTSFFAPSIHPFLSQFLSEQLPFNQALLYLLSKWSIKLSPMSTERGKDNCMLGKIIYVPTFFSHSPPLKTSYAAL